MTGRLMRNREETGKLEKDTCVSALLRPFSEGSGIRGKMCQDWWQS
jgi:hypothetical protein